MAMISSRMVPDWTRATRASMVNCSGPMPGEGRQPAQEDVVNTVEGAGLFEGHEIARLLDDADGRLVAARVAADGADGLVGLGQVEADLAMADLLLGGADRLGQLEGFLGRASQQVMGEPLGGLGADAGQASQGGDQAIHDRRVAGAGHRQGPSPPGPAARRPGRGRGRAANRRSATPATWPLPPGP